MEFWVDNANVFATDANFTNSIDVIVKNMHMCDPNYLIYVILVLS